MSRLLHIAEREVKRVQTKHEEINGTEELHIYLDWGRDSKPDLRLLTTVSVPRHIAREMRTKHND